MAITPTKLWLANHHSSPESIGQLLDLLPKVQRLRAIGYKGKRQREFVLSRLLLIAAIEENAKAEKAKWDIREQDKLPPAVTVGSEHFSTTISHSKGWIGVICTPSISDNERVIGLDIEMVRPRLSRVNAEYFCNSTQLKTFDALFDEHAKQRYLTQLWTQKEAYFKAYNQPILNADLKTLSFKKATTESGNCFPGTLLHATLASNFELAVFSREAIKLESHFVVFEPNGSINAKTEGSLNWHRPLVPKKDL